MKINITKVDNYFTANVYDSNEAVISNNENPQDRKTLTQELINIGCHKVDVFDAFEQVDPTAPLGSKLSEDTKKTYLASLKSQGSE
jgi:uncharacterized protein Smg (DUF494 family)